MRRIPKPTEQVKDIYSTCVAGFRDSPLKNKLVKALDEVVKESKKFEVKAASNTLHKIKKIKRFKSGASAKQMISVYSTKMARKKSPGRDFYDQILASAPLGICPLCGQRTVSTIDHYLDKAKYPQFVVTPINLVPACKDCNFIKSTFPVPVSSEKETMHPYFDNIENERWLSCKIAEQPGVPTTFFVDSPPAWTPLLTNRVKQHFEVLGLKSLYSTHAAVELTNIKTSVVQAFQAGGEVAVRAHLAREAHSRTVSHVNSWQTALYNALRDSIWFCQIGVNQI